MTVNVGDEIAYTQAFLLSGAVESAERWIMSTRRGIVTWIEDDWLAHVKWDDGGTRSETINVKNICRVYSIAFADHSVDLSNNPPGLR